MSIQKELAEKLAKKKAAMQQTAIWEPKEGEQLLGRMIVEPAKSVAAGENNFIVLEDFNGKRFKVFLTPGLERQLQEEGATKDWPVGIEFLGNDALPGSVGPVYVLVKHE